MRRFLVIASLMLLVAPASADEVRSSTCVLFTHPEFPVFISFDVRVDGKGFNERWAQHVKGVMSKFDVDGNGSLSRTEIAAIGGEPSAVVARFLRTPELWSFDDQPTDSEISPAEFRRFLAYRERSAFQKTRAPAGVGNASVGTRLFDLLDEDERPGLTLKEFQSAHDRLRAHDLDDDGSFSSTELLQGNSGAPTTPPASSGGAFISLESTRHFGSIVRQLATRYRDKTGGYSAKSLGLSDSVFGEFDLDGSKRLDEEELRRLLRNPPTSVDVIVRLGAVGDGIATVEVAKVHSDRVSVRKADGLMSLKIGNIQIEIGKSAARTDAVRRYLLAQFAGADRDSNGYVDSAESQRTVGLGASFMQLDADGDGKLFKSEVEEVVTVRENGARSRTRMATQDRGRDLFQILDSDRNTTLSRSEFMEAARRISLWDNNADGRVERDEVPRLYRLSFGAGQPEFPGVRLSGDSRGRTDEENSMVPIWFQKMDRNKDNLLSRREFPGTGAAFRRLDKDGSLDVTVLEAVEAGVESKVDKPDK